MQPSPPSPQTGTGSSLLRYCYPSSIKIAAASVSVGGYVYSISDFYLSLYIMNTYSQGFMGVVIAPYVLQNVKSVVTPISSALAASAGFATIFTLNLIAERVFKIKPPAISENQTPSIPIPTFSPPPNITEAIKASEKSLTTDESRGEKKSAPLPTPVSENEKALVALTKNFLSDYEKVEKKKVVSDDRPEPASTYHNVEREKFVRPNDILYDEPLPMECFGFITNIINGFRKFKANFKKWRAEVKIRKLERAKARAIARMKKNKIEEA